MVEGIYSLRLIISRVLYAHNCLQTRLYNNEIYTMVTQKYANKSHLTSPLSSRSHSTIPISVYCKTVKIQLDCLVANLPVYRHVMGIYPLLYIKGYHGDRPCTLVLNVIIKNDQLC